MSKEFFEQVYLEAFGRPAKEQVGLELTVSIDDIHRMFTAGRALGRREMKGEVKSAVVSASDIYGTYKDSWDALIDAIEAIPEEI